MKIHYRTRQVVYNNFTDSCETLLSINNYISVHQKHLQYLAVEVYRTVAEINPEFIWTYFPKGPIPYDLGKGNKVFLPLARSARYEINSLLFRGSLLWNNCSSSVQNSAALSKFTFRLKIRVEIHCTCNVCRWELISMFPNYVYFIFYLVYTQSIYLAIFNDTVFYTIQYENLFKQKVDCFWPFS